MWNLCNRFTAYFTFLGGASSVSSSLNDCVKLSMAASLVCHQPGKQSSFQPEEQHQKSWYEAMLGLNKGKQSCLIISWPLNESKHHYFPVVYFSRPLCSCSLYHPLIPFLIKSTTLLLLVGIKRNWNSRMCWIVNLQTLEKSQVTSGRVTPLIFLEYAKQKKWETCRWFAD